MAFTRRKETKDGKAFYEIIVSRGRGQSQLTTRWYVPSGWSQRSIDKELGDVARDFERKVQAGEIVNRREQKEAEKQRQLEQEEAEKQRQLEEAQIKTFQQYAELVYMPALTIGCSENTRTSYQGNLNNWIYPAIGAYKLPDITSAQVSALLSSMQAQGKSHGTVMKVLTILKSIFKAAYMEDMIDKNPMDKVPRPKPRKDEIKSTEPEACSIAEIRQIFVALEQEPIKWQAFIRLLIDTGMRRGECCGLQWKDVDFQENVITIRGNLCYTPHKGTFMDTPKNSKIRTIDVDPGVMALLRQYRRENLNLSPYVFTQEGSTEPMHPQSPGRYLQSFSKRYGFQGLHPHKLRHSFASIAITNGADVASISEILGHSDKAVTLRMYTHADRESKKRASDIYRAALKEA